MLKQNSDTSVSVSDFLVCSRWFCQQLFKTGAVFVLSPPHFFFPAFCADLVVLPVVSFFSTLLITPTATVCFMSRTANLPKGGYSWSDFNNGCITRFDTFRTILQFLARATINLFNQFCELAGNVSSMTIQNWSISCMDLTGVV